ncbi:MAG: porin family protein [Bacteroidota bacterium]
MKNYLVILSFLCCSLSYAQLQTGFKAGMGMADLQSNSSSNNTYSSRQVFYGGVFLTIHLNGFLQLQPEINYSPQGGQKTTVLLIPSEQNKNFPPGTPLYARLKTTIVLNYLEFPVLAKMTFGRKFKYSVAMGPYIGILLSAKKKISGSSRLYTDESGTVPLTGNGAAGSVVSFNSTTNIYTDNKTINAGVQGGMSIQYAVGPGSVFLEWRSIIGGGNIHAGTQMEGRMGTSSLVFAAGYLIKL